MNGYTDSSQTATCSNVYFWGESHIFKKYVYQLGYDLSQLVGTAIIYRSHKMYMKYILRVQNEKFSEEKGFILRATVKEI